MNAVRLGLLLLLFLAPGIAAHAQVSGKPIPEEIARAVKSLPPAKHILVFDLREWRKNFPDAPDHPDGQTSDPATTDKTAQLRTHLNQFTTNAVEPVISSLGWKPEDANRFTFVDFETAEDSSDETGLLFLEGVAALSSLDPGIVLEHHQNGRIVVVQAPAGFEGLSLKKNRLAIAQLADGIMVAGRIEQVSRLLNDARTPEAESENSKFIDGLNQTDGLLRGFFDYQEFEITDGIHLGRVFFGIRAENDELVARGFLRMNSPAEVAAMCQKYEQGLLEALAKANEEDADEHIREEARIFLNKAALEPAGTELRFRFGEEAIIKVLEAFQQ
jgi:hypothetical protein